MKRFLIALGILLAIFCALVARPSLVSSNLWAPAITVTFNAGSTNYGTPTLIGTVTLPSASYAIANGGLGHTNCPIDFYFFIASTNGALPCFTYFPAVTNATTDITNAPNASVFNVYVQAVGRNSTTTNVTFSPSVIFQH